MGSSFYLTPSRPPCPAQKRRLARRLASPPAHRTLASSIAFVALSWALACSAGCSSKESVERLDDAGIEGTAGSRSRDDASSGAGSSPRDGGAAGSRPDAATAGAGGAPRDGGAGATGSLDGGAGATGSLDGGGDAGQEPLCDPNEVPGEGIFVSAAQGDDLAGNGSQRLPLATIGAGVQAAVASGMGTLYVDRGTYRETVAIPDTPTGLFIEGGWNAVGTQWQRDCSETRRERTIIAGPAAASVVVNVDEIRQPSGLRYLTVTTKAQGATIDDTPGESLVAIRVRGDGGTFELQDVHVAAGDAGAGGRTTPRPAANNADANTCHGRNDCSTGATGTTPESGAPAEVPGFFDAAGYQSASGTPGTDGTDGQNGTQSSGTSTTRSCMTSCSCRTGACATNSASTGSSALGACGCGGPGGAGGRPGAGGGASVAVLVIGADATVRVERSLLEAGNGGDGADGGLGGPGGIGSQGSRGPQTTCYTRCISRQLGGCGTDCGPDTNLPIPGLPAGGPGGNGGSGSAGGAGAGGPSHAIVRVGGAQLSIDVASVLRHGAPGRGAGSGTHKAADGVASEVLVAGDDAP